MKGTSVHSQGVPILAKKLSPVWNQLKALSYSEFILSVFSGIISQGTLLGFFKPFGLAFYAAFFQGATVKVLMAVSIFLWNVLRGDLLAALKQTAVILLYEWLKKIFIHRECGISYFKNSLLAGIATAITGIFIFIVSEQILESLLIVFMEVVLACILTMLFAVTINGPEITEDGIKEHKNIEYFGVLVLGSAFLLGISGISIAWIHIDRIVAGLGLLMLTRHLGPGFGACAGCMAGLALSAGSPDSFLFLAGMYAVSGMAAGILHNSKVTAAIVYFLTQFLFIILSGNIAFNSLDAIVPAILFLIIPDLRTSKIMPIKDKIEYIELESEKTVRVCQIVSDRICDMSKALYKLGHTLEQQIKDPPHDNEEICNSIIDHLTQKVCGSCNKSIVCWEPRLFYTYSVMCNLVDSLQTDGTDSIGEAERELNRFCVKPGLVVDTLSRVIEIKRVDRVWQKILYESRNVIPEQVYCISEILTKLSGEITTNIKFYSEEEKGIETLLKKRDLPVVNVEIKRGDNGRFNVTIQFDGCKGQKVCGKIIENTVSKVLGVNMVMEEGDCKNRGRDLCVLFLKEKESLGVITGISRLKKKKASVSGDSFSFLKTSEGKYVVAISDGMGSGREANRLSEAAIDLFEQLLDCGVSIRLSLNLVDMLISLKSSEKYTTMDVASIDLYTGETEFYKMGAMPSLVLSGKSLDYIQINNLPAGLHRGDLVKCEKKKLSDGEFIIMMTDGAYDRLSEGLGEKFLEKVINTKNTLNPQEMADNLLNKACSNVEDISDDMTVLVAKVWRKAG